MLRKSFAVAAFSLSLFPLLTGCGSGGSTISTGPPAGVPTVTVSATSLTFPTTTVGQTSSPITVTVSNTGSATATLSILLTGNASSFNQTATTCGASLPASATCTISIVFVPLASGTVNLLVTVVDNSGNVSGATQNLTLSGAGSTTPVPQATLSGTTLTFPSTNAGALSAIQNVTLTNGGNTALSIASVTLGGVNLDQFSTTNTCGTSLAAGATCTINATFAPTQIGSYTATITVTDNAGNVPSSTQVVTLTGTAVGPLASFNTNSIAFAGTAINTSATAQTVMLSNTGSAALNIASASITGTGAAAFAISANTCGTALAAGSSCSISVTFTPATATTFTAALSVADNAPGSPQTVALTGTGQTSPAPIATLSATTLTFPNTVPATTSESMSATLTNTGSATLNIVSIVLSGTGSTDFTQTTTCGTTLAAGANCAISATFTPAAAQTYSATVTLTDNNNNVANSTQTVTLSGSGGTTTYHTFYVIPESDNSVTPLYALVNGAQKTIDMTMYALEDTTFTADLVAACKRGVTVRVILDQNSEKSGNTSAFNSLNAQANCSAVWANKAFSVTHEKSIMIDGTIDVVMSLNLQSQYYSTTRDYALVDNDSNDYAADEATFSTDYAAGTTSGGTVGASDYTYVPGLGTDLTWSPYPEGTSQTAMLAIINNATKTLYIECEEFSASNIVNAVAAAATRGVTVVLVGENESKSYNTEYTTIKTAGASVYYYSSSTGFYVHAKSVVADLGLSTEAVYMGSINYSTASLTANRELGVYITGNAAVSNPIAATIAATTIADESQTGVTKY